MSPSKDCPTEPLDAPNTRTTVRGFSLTSRPSNLQVSSATKATTRPSPSSTLGKRSRAALHDASEGEEEPTVRHEAITGFDIREGGALRENEVARNGPLVIPVKSGSGREQMRQEMQRRANGLLHEAQARRVGDLGDRTVNRKDVANGDVEIQWGLTLRKRSVTGEKKSSARFHDIKEDIKAESEGSAGILVEKSREKTADELAMERLTGEQNQRKEPDLVISTPANEYGSHVYRDKETDAYRRDVRLAADVPSQEDYDSIPDGEFGLAMLRGMGLREGDGKRGPVARPKDVKQRQNLLGLGATNLKGAEELGAWVQKIDPKRLGKGSPRGGERRPKANEYKEREEQKRDSREERYSGSHRRDRDSYWNRDRSKDRDRRR